MLGYSATAKKYRNELYAAPKPRMGLRPDYRAQLKNNTSLSPVAKLQDPSLSKHAKAELLVKMWSDPNQRRQLLNIKGRVDLSGLDLTKVAGGKNMPFHLVNLNGANLANMDLSHSATSGAMLKNAKMPQTTVGDMTNANISFADLRATNATGAQMAGVQAEGTNFSEAQANDIRFQGAGLQKSSFDGAQLSNAHINNSNIDGLSAINIQARGIDLSGSRGEDVRMSGNMQQANLSNMTLKNPGITADLTDANLSGTKVETSVTGMGLRPSPKPGRNNLKAVMALVGASAIHAAPAPQVQAIPSRPKQMPMAGFAYHSGSKPMALTA